jgi:hypothetical protein
MGYENKVIFWFFQQKQKTSFCFYDKNQNFQMSGLFGVAEEGFAKCGRPGKLSSNARFQGRVITPPIPFLRQKFFDGQRVPKCPRRILVGMDSNFGNDPKKKGT